ncbi:MAG: hypothetical protein J7L55_02135 [Desulfurococcales archaeon]|nr:hypothetical protein [Desulfurococcales archaeon]
MLAGEDEAEVVMYVGAYKEEDLEIMASEDTLTVIGGGEVLGKVKLPFKPLPIISGLAVRNGVLTLRLVKQP